LLSWSRRQPEKGHEEKSKQAIRLSVINNKKIKIKIKLKLNHKSNNNNK
jgi:hypothetical protein